MSRERYIRALRERLCINGLSMSVDAQEVTDFTCSAAFLVLNDTTTSPSPVSTLR